MAAPQRSRNDALLMGFALTQAQSWLAKRGTDLPDDDRRFIELSRKMTRRRSRRMRLLIGGLALPIAAVLALVMVVVVRSAMRELQVVRPFMDRDVRPYVLTAKAEHTLKPKDTFGECASVPGKDYCPQMVVVPAGSFTMGAPDSQTVSNPGVQQLVRQVPVSTEPRHLVTITAAFAVSKYEVTFDEWDTSVANGNCGQIDDFGFGREQRPAIGVSWEGAKCYVTWLSKVTGKQYRLLSEAEYEYAARAGSLTAFPWGDQVGNNNANCKDCGSKWDALMTAPVGSFPPNAFGLYDMVGNVFEWVEDCWHGNYAAAPGDGSPWLISDCGKRVIRGGSWYYPAVAVQSAFRFWSLPATWGGTLGFRVARTLDTP